jgi:hypothetical protein
VADDELLYDAECAGVSGAAEYRRSKTRPPRTHEVQLHKNLTEWMRELHTASVDRECATLMPYEVRELYRATNSRSARKAIELNYVLDDAQCNRITTEYSEYVR